MTVVTIKCKHISEPLPNYEFTVFLGNVKLKTCETILRAIAFASTLDEVTEETAFHFEGMEHVTRGLTMTSQEEYRQIQENISLFESI